ncbi:MAG: porin [Pseudoxanthomonas sp.]
MQPHYARKISRLTAAAALAFAMQAGHAAEFQAGDWKIDVGGFINAYYTYTSCGDTAVGGLALAGNALGCGGKDARSTVGNGLLPNALVTKFSGNQGGYDIGGTLAIMAHTATSSAIDPNSGVDVRQAFFTIGNESIGSFKLGRDYGVFGSNAILGDMTLLGAGAPIQATQRGRVALGHIGAGYSYLGTYGQIAWTSPAFSGSNFTVALVSPVDNGGNYDSGTGPQFQAQYGWSGNGVKVWIGGKYQKFEAPDGSGLDDFTMSGGEVGASFTAGRFSALANFQSGKGLGILSDGDQEDTKSSNWLVQGAFDATDRLKLGLNYGISKNRDETPATAGLESNANATLGAYFKLTPSVTLVGEVSRTRSKAFNGDTADMDGVALGGIVFF